MKDHKASSTAEAAAAVRALESLLPAELRLFDDPFAHKFLKPSHRALLRVCGLSRLMHDSLEQLLDRRYPGVPADFICRTRYIDGAIAETASERLVLLGAGYDTRALRLSFKGEIVEVDHPATQARKRAIVEPLLRGRPVSWMPHDFMRPPSELTARFGSPKRTFWVLEGVTGYLPRTSVEELLAWMASHSAPGSRFVLTYVHSEEVDERILKDVRKRGEPFLSSWSREQMKETCARAGIELTEDLSETELVARYLAPLRRKLESVRGFRIAKGEISK